MSRILFVEDDADTRLAIEHILLAEGYKVDVAQTCREAQAFLDNHAYDLLLADGRLPDGSGVDLANVAIHDGIPALLLTGYAFVVCATPELSRYRVLLKPVRPAEVVQAVAEALNEAIKN